MTKKGMTLTEILIVVGVIAFLVLLVTVYLRLQTLKSYDARRKAEIKRIAVAVEEYEKDKNCYPLPSVVICNPGTGLRPYIDKIPCDPLTSASYFYEHEDSICPRWYRIYSVLENESDKDYYNGIGPNNSFNYVYGSPNAPISLDSEVIIENPGSPQPSSNPTPQTDFYGCFSGVCTQIGWDPTRPGPACDPNFQNSTCYGQCANPENECVAWK